MKKTLKIILSGIFLASAILFSACTSPEQYQITVYPSDSTLGAVLEASEVNLNTKAEGTKISLTARELNAENPFVCWIKDYKTVVSNEQVLNLTYDKNTAGNYTAVFKEPSYNGMVFASLSNISFELDERVDVPYNQVEYVVNYAEISNGSNNYNVLCEGSFSLNQNPYSTGNKSVLYFGKPGNMNEYVVNVILTLKAADGSSYPLTFSFDEFFTEKFIKNYEFNGQQNLVLSEDHTEGFGTLTITFSKLDSTTNFVF